MRRAGIVLAVLAALEISAAAQLTHGAKKVDLRELLLELGQLKTTDWAAHETRILAESDPSTREQVVPRVCELLQRTETDKVWLNAVRLAGRLRATKAIPLLITGMSRGPVGGPFATDLTIQMRLEDDLVARALAQIGDPAVPSVQPLLRSDERTMRWRATLILMNVGSSKARQVLQGHLSEEADQHLKELIEGYLRRPAPH